MLGKENRILKGRWKRESDRNMRRPNERKEKREKGSLILRVKATRKVKSDITGL